MKFWKKYRVLIIVLAVVAVMVAVSLMRNAADPHAGHDHTQQGQSADPHAGHDHSDYTADKSYTITTDQNGRYTVQVKDAHGEILCQRANLTDKPTCTTVSDAVLLVGDTSSPSVSARWAVFCNVQNGKVSKAYAGCLATKGTQVAYATGKDDLWQVHVTDAFNPTTAQTYTLEGAASPDGRSVIQHAELNKDGTLSVAYWAGTEAKTTVIPMSKT